MFYILLSYSKIPVRYDLENDSKIVRVSDGEKCPIVNGVGASLDDGSQLHSEEEYLDGDDDDEDTLFKKDNIEIKRWRKIAPAESYAFNPSGF